MPIAIYTRHIGPSNRRGARVAARAADARVSPRSVTLSWDYGLRDNHEAALRALAVRLGWTGEWVAADAGHGRSVWVRVDKVSTITIGL